jgi:S-DNA-T family DNA segregation ATPase FtsK/SpoIIIE
MERHSLVLRDYYAPIWRRLCDHLGLSYTVHAAAGPTVITPRVVSVDVWSGSDPVLVVELLPGQLISDLAQHSERLLGELGARYLRISARGQRHVRIELLQADPLAESVTVPAVLERGGLVGERPVMIAQSDAGRPLWLSWDQAPHCVVQGATRSGKSVWCYSVLGQLASCRDVLITGSDPSGILLGRPYEGTRHRDWQVVGSANVLDHLSVLRRLVGEMDRRITSLPEREDKITPTVDMPLMVVVLEEFAGLLRLASVLPSAAREAKVVDQLRSLYSRLVTEGHKVGVRLLIVSQRADATIVGGFERGQLDLRISFRVTDPEALLMLHPEARDHYAAHRQAPAGVALLETLGQPLIRVRGPRLAEHESSDYARYWDQIRAASASLRHSAA